MSQATLFTVALLCCLTIIPGCSLAGREPPPDPMGTGIEATRYVFWVLGLPEGPPMTAADLHRQHAAHERRTKNQKPSNLR